ncbi:hypothetical protein TNCT_326581 [Trichonephila clavata]|uniref:Uncharacterized protein n=1 Tax=Trichonephila clavata TaxID=2740835 RepID=A0A8X6F0V2_TRICU|nr:hypothetical protein TNCT_326581 [Trichonephila clavata]
MCVLRVSKNHAVPPFIQWACGANTLTSQSRTHGSHPPCWTQVLPFVLLGLRSVFKEGIKAAATELVHSTTIRQPRDFFQDAGTSNVSEFVQHLKQTMLNLKPFPTSSHVRKTVFGHPELSKLLMYFYDMMLSEKH